MIKQGLRYIHGFVQIQFHGKETERFLNLCAAGDLTLWKIQKGTDAQTACMSVADFRKIRPAARKTKTKVRIVKRYGLPFFFWRSRKRKAFFLGMVLFLLLIYLLSLRIWNIHVEGNTIYSTRTILVCLEENNVYHGIAKRKVDCPEIAALLRKQFPRLIWVSARIEGTRLLVEVKENREDVLLEQEAAQEKEPCDIVAHRDGRVISIVTRSGVPRVSAGQTFKKGDILVSGTLEIKNDAQEVTGYEYVTADADIWVFLSYSYYDEFSRQYTQRIYTGEDSRGFFFNAFSYRFDFGLRPDGDVRYDQITDTRTVCLTENFVLPFSYGTTQIRPYEIRKKTYTKEEAIQKANRRLYTFLKNLTQKGVEIYRKDVKIDTSANMCVMKGKILVKEMMRETSPVEKREVTKERTSDT